MKKTKKALLLVLCAILLVGATIAGTVAYLTDTDDVVTNTFTIGNVEISMDEAYVNAYGELLYKDGEDAEGNPQYTTTNNGEIADRVTGNAYKLIPGHTYIKDPTITIDAASESCYVFVKIENELGTNVTIKDKDGNAGMNAGWELVAGTTNVYAYNTVLENVDGKRSATPFSQFTVAETVDSTFTVTNDTTITVTAYAIQADGMDGKTAAEIWALF